MILKKERRMGVSLHEYLCTGNRPTQSMNKSVITLIIPSPDPKDAKYFWDESLPESKDDDKRAKEIN